MTTATEVPMRHQLDRNAGRAGGLLLSVLQEPTGFSGVWELFTSARVPTPDGVLRSKPWVPRRATDECQVPPTVGGV